jgi:hypothetical protein
MLTGIPTAVAAGRPNIAHASMATGYPVSGWLLAVYPWSSRFFSDIPDMRTCP